MMEGVRRRRSSGAALTVACAIATTTLLAAGLLVSACGNDFDALFPTDPSAFSEAGPSTTSTSGTTGGTSGTSNPTPRPDNDGAPSNEGGAGDAGVDSGGLKCGVPLTTCPPPQTAEQGGDITNVCVGCGCTCPPFPCNQGGRENCTTTCNAGAICSATCDVDHDCKMVATNATSAKFTCTNNDSDKCELDCQGNSSCEVDCQHDRDCIARCQATSNCVVKCGGQTNACNVDCMGGVKKDCPAGGNKQVITCNRDCPP